MPCSSPLRSSFAAVIGTFESGDSESGESVILNQPRYKSNIDMIQDCELVSNINSLPPDVLGKILAAANFWEGA